LYDAVLHSDSAMAVNLCDDLQGNDIVMENIKTMNAFLIKPENYHFTNADSTIINGIAYQRVQKGGPAVVTARNWLGIYLNDAELPNNKSLINDDLIDSDWEVNLFPNPSNGMLKIVSSTSMNLKLVIFDALGKTVKIEDNIESTSTLEFKDLTNGIYLIKITDSNQNQKSFRWTIQK
jgi:Secretion system C-terminal sorting domain